MTSIEDCPNKVKAQSLQLPLHDLQKVKQCNVKSHSKFALFVLIITGQSINVNIKPYIYLLYILYGPVFGGFPPNPWYPPDPVEVVAFYYIVEVEVAVKVIVLEVLVLRSRNTSIYINKYISI